MVRRRLACDFFLNRNYQELTRNYPEIFYLNGKDSEYFFKTAIILFLNSNYQQLDSNYQQFFPLNF